MAPYYKTFDENKRATDTIVSNGTGGKLVVHYKNTYKPITIRHNAFREYNKPTRLKLSRRESEQRVHLGANHFDTYTFDASYRMTGFRQNGTALNTGGIQSSRTFNDSGLMTAFKDKGSNRSVTLQENKYTRVGDNSISHSDNDNITE